MAGSASAAPCDIGKRPGRSARRGVMMDRADRGARLWGVTQRPTSPPTRREEAPSGGAGHGLGAAGHPGPLKQGPRQSTEIGAPGGRKVLVDDDDPGPLRDEDDGERGATVHGSDVPENVSRQGRGGPGQWGAGPGSAAEGARSRARGGVGTPRRHVEADGDGPSRRRHRCGRRFGVRSGASRAQRDPELCRRREIIRAGP